MVEFSKPQDLERWLDDKPREWTVVIAARAALRVVPVLARGLDARGGRARKISGKIVLPVLRATAVSWFAATWPSHGEADLFAAGAAAAAADDSYPASGVARAAAATASGAAAYAGYAAYAVTAAEHAAAADAAHAAAAAATAAATADGAAAEHEFWAEVSADASALEGGEPPTNLITFRLWITATPNWASDHWSRLKRGLLALNEDWGVWSDWYEARMRGGPAHEALELARVRIPNDILEKGPKVVNAHIKKLIEDYDHQQKEIADSAWDDRADNHQIVPAIPELRRAAIEPVWREGRLTIPARPITVDLQKAEFRDALRSLRTSLQQFAGDLDGEANIDRRFVAYLRTLADQISDDAPPQHELFALGHAEEVFTGYAASVNEEWPDFLAARYHALVRQHDRTMRQAPAWREFKLNAARDSISFDQVVAVGPIAAQFADLLRDDEARDFVDDIIPNTLDSVAEPLSRPPPNDARDEWRHAIEAGNELLALDVIESINNILKPIAELALTAGRGYGSSFAEGFKDAAKKQGTKDGEKAFKWLRRIAIASTAGGAGIIAGPHFAALAELLGKYPHMFEWLTHVLKFLA